MRTERDTSGKTHLVDVRVSGAQRDWLLTAGERERPRLDAGQMLARLVEQAMNDCERETHRRNHQLEVYRASGYAEHHPDYPNSPRRLADV